MKTNVGTADRMIRLVLGVVLVVLFFSETVTGTSGFVLMTAGIVFVVTSIVGFCPLYSLVGFNTCPTKKHNASN